MGLERHLTPPCAYQGGKQRIAEQIVDIILRENPFLCDQDDETKFYDLCCGSGAISMELINRGVMPYKITMVDASPWGLFYKMVGEGTFSTEVFKFFIDDIPKDVSRIQSHMKYLSKGTAYKTQIDLAYIFLLLQASSFGSKSIWMKDDKWQNCSFRNYWLPTETSSRRSPVNPMMPMPYTLLSRVEPIVERMEGVNGYYGDINDIAIEKDSIVYIDPPYDKTTKYGFVFDYKTFVANNLRNKLYLSEGKQLTDIAYRITSARTKGGISGNRKRENEEWLNIYGNNVNN